MMVMLILNYAALRSPWQQDMHFEAKSALKFYVGILHHHFFGQLNQGTKQKRLSLPQLSSASICT